MTAVYLQLFLTKDMYFRAGNKKKMSGRFSRNRFVCNRSRLQGNGTTVQRLTKLMTKTIIPTLFVCVNCFFQFVICHRIAEGSLPRTQTHRNVASAGIRTEYEVDSPCSAVH